MNVYRFSYYTYDGDFVYFVVAADKEKAKEEMSKSLLQKTHDPKVFTLSTKIEENKVVLIWNFISGHKNTEVYEVDDLGPFEENKVY